MFDPFGNVLAGTGSAVGSPFRYCGAAGYQTSPDSGLMLAGHRWYDPATGRFLTRDPAGSGDNPYAYCGNNPVSNMDPLGLQSEGAAKPPAITISGGGDGSGSSDDLSGLLSNGLNYIKNLFGIGHHSESPSKPTQGPGGSTFIGRLTHGTYGGGVMGVLNNAVDAHTYGLAYAPFLAGTDYIGDYGGAAINVSGGLLLVLLSPPVAGAAGIEELAEIDMGDLLTRQSNLSGPRVERYVMRLLAGETPPPITYDDEGAIIEGNHRYVAGQIAKIPVPRVPGVGPSNPRPIVPWNKVFFDPVDW